MAVQPLNAKLQERGSPYIAADATSQAGEGDVVLVVFSGEAAVAFAGDHTPVDASIVGLVDRVSVEQLSLLSTAGNNGEDGTSNVLS